MPLPDVNPPINPPLPAPPINPSTMPSVKARVLSQPIFAIVLDHKACRTSSPPSCIAPMKISLPILPSPPLKNLVNGKTSKIVFPAVDNVPATLENSTDFPDRLASTYWSDPSTRPSAAAPIIGFFVINVITVAAPKDGIASAIVATALVHEGFCINEPLKTSGSGASMPF